MRREYLGFVAVCLAVALGGCAGDRFHRAGLRQLAEGKPEEGLRSLAQAVKEEPRNVEFKADLLVRRADEVNRMLLAAHGERNAGKWDAAVAQFRQVLLIEPGNPRATEGIVTTMRERRYAELLLQAADAARKGHLEQALAQVGSVLADSPQNTAAQAMRAQLEEQSSKQKPANAPLFVNQRKPLSLDFRDAGLRVVLDALTRSTGVNFTLDKDVSADLRTTINLRRTPFEDAIELILQTNRLEKKLLSPTSILIYPNTPEKLKEHQELMVKGFYLSNADVKQTQAMLKSMLKAKEIFIDEKINLLMMRDTPDAIRLAEKLIAMQDLYEPELMLEVEVLEVKRSRLTELGVKLPTQMTFSPIAAQSIPTLQDLRNISSERIATAMPSATVNLRREIGDAKILANPRIRARNREKAKVMIGDKVPVVSIVTTSTGVSSENIQYLDVGIKLEVESNVLLQDEAAIKVSLEVSSLVREVRTPSGSLAYQIGSRSASTVLQLKDGETQVLAGLISDEDRTTASRLPGVGDIPLLGRLFSSQKDEKEKTEIVLSITPHLIRNINRPDPVNSEFSTGSEMSLRAKPLQMDAAVLADEGKAGKGETADVPAMTDSEGRGNLAPTLMSLAWQAPKSVKVGDEFKVALRLKADGGVRSLPFQVGFDPAVLQVVEVAEGPFFKQGGAQTSISSSVDAGKGRIFASVVRAGTDGAFGDADAALFTLRALAAKPQTEMSILMTAPVAVGGASIVPAPPAPLQISVGN